MAITEERSTDVVFHTLLDNGANVTEREFFRARPSHKEVVLTLLAKREELNSEHPKLVC